MSIGNEKLFPVFKKCAKFIFFQRIYSSIGLKKISKFSIYIKISVFIYVHYALFYDFMSIDKICQII